MKRVERGVMIMKDGKAWGETYADGHSTEYGWMDPCRAPIHDPMYCTSTEDVTYTGSHYTKELKTGKVVRVERTTTVVICGN